MSERLHPLSELAWESVDALVAKKVISTDRMTVTRYRFQPGGRFPLHVHPQQQVTFVLAGRLTFTTGREEDVVDAENLIVIEEGAPHVAVAGPEGAEVVSIVVPPRTASDGITILEPGGGT